MSTIRAFGTDCAVTNTTISYADGRTKETLLNGVVKTAYEYGPNWTKTYEGPAGLASPRWSCSYEDALGRTISETRPGFRGALLVTSNEYNTANQLVATRTYVLNENSTPVAGMRLTICRRIGYTVFVASGGVLHNPVGYRITPPVATLNIHPIANAVSEWDANERIYYIYT